MIDAITKYRESCNEIIALFCQKQDVKFSFWAGQGIEGLALLSIGGSAFFNGSTCIWMNDIIFDLESEQPKGLIFDWLKSQRINGRIITPYRQFVNQQK